jgi:hypothetical protein
VEGVDPDGPADGAQLTFTLADQTVPEGDVTVLDLADVVLDLAVEIEPDDSGQLQCLIHGEIRGLDGVPGEDEPFGQGVEVVRRLTVASWSIRHRFTSRRAASRASSGRTA